MMKRRMGFTWQEKKGLNLSMKVLIKIQKDQSEKIEGMEYGCRRSENWKSSIGKNFIVTIEPMHGDKVVVYSWKMK